MKEFAFLPRITAVVTYGQTPASSKSKSDSEKIASALGAGPKSVTRNATELDWPTSCPAVSSTFSGLAPMGGQVFRAFQDPPMMNLAALTRSFCTSSRTALPVARPMCRVSEFHICMVASGYLTSPMRWELVMNSTLGHTS